MLSSTISQDLSLLTAYYQPVTKALLESMDNIIPHVTVDGITGGVFEPSDFAKDDDLCGSFTHNFADAIGNEYSYHALGKKVEVYLK